MRNDKAIAAKWHRSEVHSSIGIGLAMQDESRLASLQLGFRSSQRTVLRIVHHGGHRGKKRDLSKGHKPSNRAQEQQRGDKGGA